MVPHCPLPQIKLSPIADDVSCNAVHASTMGGKLAQLMVEGEGENSGVVQK